jgi:hypothetical protein
MDCKVTRKPFRDYRLSLIAAEIDGARIYETLRTDLDLSAGEICLIGEMIEELCPNICSGPRTVKILISHTEPISSSIDHCHPSCFSLVNPPTV